MHWQLLTAVIVLAAPAPADDGKKDAENIQGTWKVVSMEHAGEKAPEDKIKDVKFVIGDGTIAIKDPRREEKAKFKLDPTKTPKTIDLTAERNEAVQGIYELKGDSLKLCFIKGGGERPSQFATKAGTEQALIVLEREKKDK
jgi:uncharacterized protein (TIGR03067 family)